MQYTLISRSVRLPADTCTPVLLFLQLRDHFPDALLLETSGQPGAPSRSYICLQPLAGIQIQDGQIRMSYPGGAAEVRPLTENTGIPDEIDRFMQAFDITGDAGGWMTDGLHGYMSYDICAFFEGVHLQASTPQSRRIPGLCLHLYRYVLALDPYRQELLITERYPATQGPQGISRIESLIRRQQFPLYPFRITGSEAAACSDTSFLDMVVAGKGHCYRGDVFQIVLSRAFSVPYHGDDFQVYRQLRAVNPSPYLFYADYGYYRLLGSSPEAQLVIRDQTAKMYPIAGTFRKTDDAQQDALLADQLVKDPKENAEHVMLVDLARNDLGKSHNAVDVTAFREVHQYAHVMHMVSEVSATGRLAGKSGVQVLADSFPAGTLSGAPKHRAIQLIDHYEGAARGYYGGCIGYLGLNGDVNMAIVIRSILCKDRHLHYQAGAGIVAASVPEKELAEVDNKLRSLRTAIYNAHNHTR